ncbi:hypothetical protein B0H17DRAFT_1209508 [Mycena rosella]|uniref:Uncharacterized protein n=1 Tax=Mycena rosella TaxID=1033263 RepID=A0AAD7CY84_MYCRO|nr:hypothetical protein B0H17DRAFT_1209508 [Mycena rosella]
MAPQTVLPQIVANFPRLMVPSLPTLAHLEAIVTQPDETAAAMQFLSCSQERLTHLTINIFRTLTITDALLIVTYTPFLVLPRARSVLTRAELHMRPRQAYVAPPEHALLAECEALAVQGRSVHITTPAVLRVASGHPR